MFNSLRSATAKVATAVVATVGTSAVCLAEGANVTIPNINADVSSFISQGITMVGSVVAVALGGYVAFWVVRKGLRWFSKAA